MKKTAQELHVAYLTKMANDFTETRAELLPVIQSLIPASQRYAHLVKKAFSEESEQFVAWCLMKADKWSPAECQRLLDRVGVPFVETLEKSDKGPLLKGEQVKVFGMTNTNAKNTDMCHEFNDQVGFVTDIDDGAVIVKFERGGVGRFEGTLPGKETGLGRFKPSAEADKRANIELVYFSDPSAVPSKMSIKRVREYVSKGLATGESRADCYYVGLPTVQTLNAAKQYYVKYRSLTRDGDYRSFNPTKGKVLYLGLLGHRPGGWKDDFAKMVADDTDTGED